MFEQTRWSAPAFRPSRPAAIGLLAGLAVPALGVAAAVGLILYFLGGVVTVLRARSCSTVVFPLLYLAPVAVTLGLGVAA